MLRAPTSTMTTPTSIRLIATLVLAAAMMIAACGDEGEEAPAATAPEAAPPATTPAAPAAPAPAETPAVAAAEPTDDDLYYGPPGGEPAAETPTPAETPPSAAPGEVVESPIANFVLESLTVSAGTTIRWENEDGVPHTSTARDGSWQSPSLPRGGVFEHTFTESGTFEYFCAVHPAVMVATITVE